MRAAGGHEGGQRLHTAEMLARLIRVGRHTQAIPLLQRQTQLQCIYRIQAQALDKQWRGGVNVVGRDVFQRQAGDDDLFDFLLKLKHRRIP